MIHYKCQSCGCEMQSPESLSGEMEECPECHQFQAVPRTGQAGGEDGPADRTLLPGRAYQSQLGMEATRVPEAGYQSLLAVSKTDSAPERYKVGDRIGDCYEVLAIHKGSMGIVYATFDHQEKLPRALKTLQQRFAANRRMRDLFAEEAALWVKLEKHPFIVRAYLVKNFEHQPFVITEYIRGRAGMGGDLRSWLGSPSLTLPVAVEMALQIAQGMQHAAKKVPGLVHRDLKPANVLVDDRGRAMVTDFGLVHAAQADAGTPAYMAPEQWRRETLDARADVYAFGCMLYEMFTGHRLFSAESVEQWRQCHLTQMPVVLRSFKAAVHVDLENLVLRCLGKDPAGRPGTWDEVVEQCAAWFHRITGQPAVLDFSAYDLTVEELIPASFSLLELEKYSESLEICDRALALEPDAADAWCSKGVALGGLARYQEMLGACDHALALRPDFVEAWLDKGAALSGLGRHEEALAACDRALALKPTLAEAWGNKGAELESLGRHEEALAACDRVLALKPDYAVAWGNKAAALSGLGRHEEALGACDRALALKPDDAGVWRNKGGELSELGRHEEALAACDRALALKPALAEAWDNKGVVLGRLARYEEALAAYDRALAMKPDDAVASRNKGLLLESLGRHEEALAAYDRALALKPNDAVAWRNKGFALSGLARHEEALAACDRALALKPDDAEAWGYKGFALSGLGRHEEALGACDRALALKPDDAEAWGYKGLLLKGLGRYEEALAACDRSLALKPDNFAAWLNKGLAFYEMGRLQETLVALDRSLAINPNQLALRKIRDQLAAQLRNSGGSAKT